MRIGKKTIHDVTIGLAMALPILYLGGSMIAGLCGAHGEQLWADPIYVEQAVQTSYSKSAFQVDVTEEKKEYFLEAWFSGSSPYSSVGEFNGVAGRLTYGSWSPSTKTLFWLSNGGNYQSVGSYDNGVITWSNTNLWTFVGDNPFITYVSKSLLDLTYYSYVSVPTAVVPENNSSYTVFLFENFFPKNNFVARIGENALSENPKGFAPFGTMLSYLDSNVFHAGDSQTALMVYGMVYWSLHVIIADLVYHVLVFVPNLINKVFDWFGQRGLNDD